MMLLILTAILLGFVMLAIFAPVNDITQQMNDDVINPLTSVVTPYTDSSGATIPNYNTFDNVIASNLWIIGVLLIIVVVIVSIGKINRREDY